jgi:cytohesin
MLEHGADVNARDKDQATPLHYSSYMSKLETPRVLLDHGANIHAKNVKGQTPLNIVSQGDSEPILDLSDSVAPGIVRLLQSRVADVNARDDNHATPFLLTSSHWRPEATKALLKNGADVNAVNIHGQNALHLISQHPCRHCWWVDLEWLLLECGVEMNVQDNDKRTLLHLAAYFGQVTVAEELLEHVAKVNVTDIWGHTPLHQVTLGMGNYNYRSSSMKPWQMKEHPRRVIGLAKCLLESGADVNVQNEEHEIPLHIASCLRLHEMVQLLLEHSADVSVMNSEGKTLLQLATGRKGKAMRQLLSEYSAKHA